MTKALILNFDGTDNEPQDAVQSIERSGEIEDESITNILKFHLLIGGTLKSNNEPLANGSRCFYYNGVGTYGHYFERKLNAGLACEGDDVATIINRAMRDFNQYYEQLDEAQRPEKIVVTGFSRGGAIARRVAYLISKKIDKPMIIEGIFDTVASIGLPNLSQSDRPKSDVVFENGCTLPENVETALHLVSLDDKRRAFQPTLMNKDQARVKEVWFAGAHSDVGGGYYHDGLSDMSLRFFLDWFEDLNLGVPLLTSKTIDYDNLVDDNVKYRIGPDDVQIDADAFGVNHQQRRSALVAWATLTDRRCCVIEGDRINRSEKPLVHWSVAERIAGDRNYRPKSLENLEHNLVYPDGYQKSFTGISEHKQAYKRKFRLPGEGDAGTVETFVFAYQKYNHTGIYLQKGKTYLIEVCDQYKWHDGGVKQLDGLGWQRDDVAFGLKEVAIAAMEPFRRVDAPWFTLCGCFGDDDSTAFVIGNGLDHFTANQSGELCAFANDLDGFYGNNTGKLKIKIRLKD